MKFINELLGFAVLSAPLLIIVAIVIISLGIAIFVSKKFFKPRLKLVGGIGVFVVVMFLFFGDEIVGRMYFNYLCDTKAYVHVYQVVELPVEYWSKDGKAKFYRYWDELLGSKYKKINKSGIYSVALNIESDGYKFIDKKSGKVLGDVIDYMYWGGWIRKNLSLHKSASRCIDYSLSDNRLIDRVFLKIK